MRSSIWKSTFREIRESFGRFFAILAIIALGVGFFAGLKVTRTAMIATTEKYLEEQQFYDYRLLSTMGFDTDGVSFFAGQENVRVAEGAVAFDVLYRNTQGNEGVIKVHSISEQVNLLKLTAGRMPAQPDECVVDANLYNESQIGEKIVLSEENEQEDLEHFAYTEYTVVGIVQSPLYIQYERGNTSLGTGKINGFVYIRRDGFAVDYDTEIYVKCEEDFHLYSEEYKDYIEEHEAAIERLTEAAAGSRYENIREEANSELADAKEELAEKQADGEQELADAKKELEDAQAELTDGEKQIADAKEELAEADKTLAEKKQELADAKVKVAENETELVDAEQTLKDGIAEWNKQNDSIEEAKKQVSESQKLLQEQTALLAQEEAELSAGETGLAAAEAGLNQTKEQLDVQEAALDALEASFGGNALPPEAEAQLTQGRTQITAAREQLNAGYAELAQQAAVLADGKKQLEAGKQQAEAAGRQLSDAEEQIRQGDKELGKAWQKILDGQAELEDGRNKLTEAKEDIAEGDREIPKAEKELAKARDTLAEKEQELADGQAEYADGLKEYEDGLEEFDEKIEEAKEKLADAEKELDDLQSPDTYVLGRDTNIGYVCFENDSNIVEGIANIFPVFFFLVAALVCITTMNRMVEEQRTQIGVLKALGYGEAIIMSKYMVYSGTAAVLGCVLGYFGGTYLFPRVIWTAYGLMYHVDTLVYVFDWKLAVIALVVSLLCSIGTTWISCRYELFQVAAQLMRPKAPRAGKRVLLEYIPFIWKRMGFLRKVSFRNIFRYKKRLFMMIIGISGCTALLVTGFGIKDSIANVAIHQFEEIQTYDVGVTFSEAVTGQQKEKLSALKETGLEEQIYVMEQAIDLVTENAVKSVNCVVTSEPEKFARFTDLHTTKGTPVAYPGKGEAVICNKLADTYNLQVGDSIKLQDENMREITAVISGIHQNFIYNYVYLSEDTYTDQMGEKPTYKTAYLNLAEDSDAHVLTGALMKIDGISSVTVNADMMERVTSMMESLNLIVIVVILCAAGLAFIVLYNLTNINITERIREIATIKVLGFYKKETASYVFRENIVLTFLGTLVGLVLGKYLHLFVMNEVQIDMICFDIRVLPISYCYSFLLTLVFAWFVNKVMGRKLDRISMTESLKSVD